MRAAVRKNSSLSELSALRCSFTFHREISPDSPDLSLGNDYHSKYFLISTDICRWRETENDVAGLQWVVYFLLGEGLDFRKLKLSIKKSSWDVLTGAWLWWRDPIAFLPHSVTHSSHHRRVYCHKQSDAAWVSDGCCVIPPLPWPCRLIPLPPRHDMDSAERSWVGLEFEDFTHWNLHVVHVYVGISKKFVNWCVMWFVFLHMLEKLWCFD